jgi:hypothetical protein
MNAPQTTTIKEDSMRTLLPRMSRRTLLAGAAVIALAAAGIAIADSGSPASTTLVSATFFANTLVKSHTNTCTPASGDAFANTDAVFTGTASSSDPRLAGPITIHVKSAYDSTKNVGSLNGNAFITTTGAGHFNAQLSAVNVNGAVQGWLNGRLGDGSRFMGGFSATFSPTGGFSSSGAPATIGSGTGTNTTIASSGHCMSGPAPGPHHDNGQGNHGDNHGHHH